MKGKWARVFVIMLVGLFVGMLGLGRVVAAPTATIADLKIGEVQVGGVTAADEYVELYNSLPAPVTGLSGATLHLHTVNSSGTDVDKTLTFTNTTVPAHGHFLLCGTGYRGTTLCDASYSTSSGALVTNGAVYISTSAIANTGMIDLLGWGTNTSFEGTAFNSGGSYAPPNGASIERKPAASAGNGSRVNNVDTNDNSVDFLESATSSPENAASPTAVTLSSFAAHSDPVYDILTALAFGVVGMLLVFIARRRAHA